MGVRGVAARARPRANVRTALRFSSLVAGWRPRTSAIACRVASWSLGSGVASACLTWPNPAPPTLTVPKHPLPGEARTGRSPTAFASRSRGRCP